MAKTTDPVSGWLEVGTSSELGVTVGCMDLTRDRAEFLASKIPEYQRRVRKSWVAQLARLMDEGLWRLAPDGLSIVVDEVGGVAALENGQHRVLARLAATQENPCFVLVLLRFDHSHDNYLVTDGGMKRSFADWLQAHGVANAKQAASLVKLCSSYDELGVRYIAGGAVDKRLTVGEEAEWYKTCDESLLGEAVRVYQNAQKELGGTAARHLAMVYYIASRDWPDADVSSFVEVVVSGRVGYDSEGLAPAAQVLHDRLIKWKIQATTGSSKSLVPQPVVAKAIVKAWQYHTSGEYLKILKVPAKWDNLEVVPLWASDLAFS